MAKDGSSYSEGKIGESQTWELLAQHGYRRPDKHERDQIFMTLKAEGLEIEKRGFDVYRIVNGVYYLYEVKTTGIERGASISSGFRGLGFTLTSKEIENAKLLGDRYAFLFVNLASRLFREYTLEEFFHEDHARIYQTWSVFISRDLNGKKDA